MTTNTMEHLADVATRVVMLTTQGVLTTALIALMLFLYDWRIGLVLCSGMVLFFAVNSWMQQKAKTIAPRKTKSDSALVEKVIEYVQGIAEVKGYNLTGKTAKKLEAAIDNNTEVNIAMELIFVPFMALQNGVIKLTGVAMTLLSIWFYLQGSMALLTCIGMTICSFMVFASLEQAGNYSTLLRVIGLTVDKAQDILNLPAMDIEGKNIVPENHNVELSNVDFSYEKKKIINNVSLRIPEKTTTAIVGPSGGGKTTLCHLIARFWDADRGSVLFDGRNVKEYSYDSLMRNFSFVFQNVYLFQDTIANNIRFGQEDAPMERVVEAAKKACCHDFIMALPDRYDTVIGEDGGSISKGQKQLLTIARAMLYGTNMLILDEATSNVDTNTERQVQKAIRSLMAGKTCFVIAHRLSTIQNADKILVVDQGDVVEQGTHQSLMLQKGVYYQLYASQFG